MLQKVNKYNVGKFQIFSFINVFVDEQTPISIRLKIMSLYFNNLTKICYLPGFTIFYCFKFKCANKKDPTILINNCFV